ncbi:DUF333 domain-containing protein [Vibrio tubiashii]|uniref:DUF333 domain-containing protein n=1 Tax=Vibrio tubiashii TaxID=29498 RepID=UPI003CE460EC
MRTLILSAFACVFYTPAFASTHTTMPKGANPAEQFCINKGGVIKTAEQTKVCVFPNGTEIEPDALLRGEKPSEVSEKHS